jgi:hypothetical protein
MESQQGYRLKQCCQLSLKTGLYMTENKSHFHVHINDFVNGAGTTCDQRTSKFFVSSREESITGHMVLNGVY